MANLERARPPEERDGRTRKPANPSALIVITLTFFPIPYSHQIDLLEIINKDSIT
jgi:hypothetical protein